MPKNILITGGTGFIGKELCPKLIESGYQLTVLSRQQPSDVKACCGRVKPVSRLEELREHEGFDGIINLAGEGIAGRRWSDSRKQVLRDSRIGLTQSLVEICRQHAKRPDVMVSGSAVGFYGDQGQNVVDEDSEPHDEFTHQLCRDWEQAAIEFKADGVRVCLSRTGVVAGPGGGFLQQMLLPFRLGLGGRLGSGTQYMPWVHRTDVVNSLVWMLENDAASGAYNVVSPNPVSNAQFTRTLGRVLGRPTVIPAPALLLKAGLGEMSRLLLTGQQAYPRRLEKAGFVFRYPELEGALRDAVGV